MKLAVIQPATTSGGTMVFAGRATGPPVGTAAVLANTHLSGAVSVGTVVIYTAKGTLKATIRNQIQVHPDGSASFPGTFKVTRGTGKFRGATGSGTFNGTVPGPGGPVYSFTVRGVLRY